MQLINVILLATAVTAQSLSSIVAQIPSCALTCLATGAAAAGCAITDYACQCGDKRATITTSATPCVLGQCSSDDALKVLPLVNQLCAAVASSPASSTPAAATTPAQTTPAPATTSTSAAAATTTTAAATTSTKAATTSTGSSIQSVSVKPSATTSSFVQVPTGAASNLKAGAGVIGGAVLMALVL